ncbi:hypothetical protein CHS0354_036360 [Potamilus streckersoni]|uniref:Chitin-binding type-2 domain-containing protein n=1 Tax=Potamilus streckersoni TaxID=2493646 RepID=A0AAE0SRA7_9BIVA|nr:hypothetical protein CHS0354_036360 [Potamilus streckersoni]
MERFTFLINFILAMLYATKTAASPSCVDSCFGVKNGYYQYCLSCQQYVTCVYGIMYIRPCPDDLEWDDEAKKCVWTSTTCDAKSNSRRFPLEVVAPKGCVDSCFGVQNGEYQYCSNCHQYVSCAYGFKFIMPCPDHLVWDDFLKKCNWVSSTCQPHARIFTSDRESPKGCVKSCEDVRDGQYQYCPDCRHYVSCVHGNMYIIPCSSDKLWDDNEKRCVRISFTCAALGTDNHD